MGLKVGTVALEEYNALWVTEFEKEKELLRNILGDYIQTVEHIGSTAILGLISKPIIDIAIGVNTLNMDYIKEMFSDYLDYLVKEDSVDGEVLVVKRFDEDTTTHLIHIMECDKDRYKETILFRDYMINHPEELSKYVDLKKELAKKYSADRKMYTKSKNEFICEILSKAHK